MTDETNEMSAEERRRATIKSLVELSDDASDSSCFSPDHADSLLRGQSSPGELRDLGVSEERVERIFGAAAGKADEGDRDEPAGRFAVRVQARFEAAHFLRSYRGITEPLHGHSYRVVAELAREQTGLDQDELAVDFIAARDALRSIASKLDYTCINDVEPFTRLNPTAENVAQWIAGELQKELRAESAVVLELTLYEGPENSVVYRRVP